MYHFPLVNFLLYIFVCRLIFLVKTVTYSKLALKVLSRIQPKLAARIMDKVDQFAVDPESQANNVKALVGSAHIRLRVGGWRVIMNDQGVVLLVLEIGPRGDIYK